MCTCMYKYMYVCMCEYVWIYVYVYTLSFIVELFVVEKCRKNISSHEKTDEHKAALVSC